MSWKVPILALESYCHGQKVGYLSQFKEEKIQLPLGVRGAKAAALFSIFGTGKYSNFKIIVSLNSMHNTVETVHVDRLCQEHLTFVRALP